ncbi:hypothetical protein [Nonomuraea insulae]|uniref:Uncharacterized protein n=1 Tax=Nonomuraea insulae TaxID=1616787 RepID=A0ABW1D816_9ACTN
MIAEGPSRCMAASLGVAFEVIARSNRPSSIAIISWSGHDGL